MREYGINLYKCRAVIAAIRRCCRRPSSQGTHYKYIISYSKYVGSVCFYNVFNRPIFHSNPRIIQEFATTKSYKWTTTTREDQEGDWRSRRRKSVGLFDEMRF